MNMVKLFDINTKERKALPTKDAYMISFFKDILDKYGEDIGGKILFYVHSVCDINPNTNIFAQLSEESRKEEVIRAVVGKDALKIDMDDILIEQALDLAQNLYKTEKYQLFEAIKSSMHKITEALKYIHVDLTKSNGNVDQINKTLSAFNTLNTQFDNYKKAYLEELVIKENRGGKKDSIFSTSSTYS